MTSQYTSPSSNDEFSSSHEKLRVEREAVERENIRKREIDGEGNDSNRLQVGGGAGGDGESLFEVEGEGVPRYEASPGGSSSGGEGRMSVISMQKQRQDVVAPTPTDAENPSTTAMLSREQIEEWRNRQNDRERGGPPTSTAVARRGSIVSSSSRSVGGNSSAGGSTVRRNRNLAEMTDAEIAQHHFRLAQQHLEAAQRLAMAASQGPLPSPPPSLNHANPDRELPGNFLSASSAWTDHQTEASSSTSHYDESSSSYYSPISPRDADNSDERLASEFGSFSMSSSSKQGMSQARRQRSFSVSEGGSKSPLPPPPTALPPTPSVPSEYLNNNSFERRDEKSSQSRSTQLPTTPQYPTRISPRPDRQPPTAPRSRPSKEHFESASTLSPSLYGGGLPRAVRDRYDSLPVPPSSASASSASPHPQQYSTAPSSVENDYSVDGHGGREGSSAYGDDFDDGASDFHDVQSTFSHVTTATLPPYDFGGGVANYPNQHHASAPPPIPRIPEEYNEFGRSQPSSSMSYQGSLRSQPSYSTSINSRVNSEDRRARTAQASTDHDEFMGFRPRFGPRPSTAPSASSIPYMSSAQYAPSPTSYRAREQYLPTSSQPPSHSYPAYSAPTLPTSTAQLQPHSYILSPDGRPIPVYASPLPSAPTSYSQPQQLPSNVSRAPLAIHSQPLEFNHALSYNTPVRQNAISAIPPAQAHAGQSPYSNPQPHTQQQYLGAPPSASNVSLPSPTSFVDPSSTYSSMTSLAQPTHSRPPTSASMSSNSSSISDHSTYPLHSQPQLPSSLNSSGRAKSIKSPAHQRLMQTSLSLRKMVRSPHVRFKSPEPLIDEVPPASMGSFGMMARDLEKDGEGEGEGEGEGGKRERNAKAMTESLRMLM